MRKDGFVISMDGHGPDEMHFGYHGLMKDSMQYMLWNTPNKNAIPFIEAFASRFDNPDDVKSQLLVELKKSNFFTSIPLAFIFSIVDKKSSFISLVIASLLIKLV